MNPARKINLLVIPDLFPKFEGDVQGIFLLDYLRASEPFCNNRVLFVRAHGAPAGLQVNQEQSALVYRYNISGKKRRGPAKLFNYIQWFRKGKKTAGQIAEIDLVHAHGSILSGTLAWMIAKKRKIPFVLTEHVGPFSVVSESAWRRRWTKFIMEKADLVLCVSEHQKSEVLQAGIKPRRIEVSYNPVDTVIFHPAEAGTAHKNILFAGRLDEFKGGLRSVQAFSRLARQYADWTLTIVGEGQEETVIKDFIARNPGVAGRVIMKGTRTKAQLAEEMREADFFLFPSRHESFGLVVAEALASGLPVVTTDRTAPKEFVSAESGLLADPDKVGEITAAMEIMIREHARYNPHILHNHITARFSIENFGKKLSAAYASLLLKQ